MKTLALTSFIFALCIGSCTDDISSLTDDNNDGNAEQNNNSDWLIPENEVRDGGPGKDGIPAIDDPKFASVDESSWLNDNDLVLGFADGDDIRAYPHPILDWHEIVNDKTDKHSLAVIYCPLTGTGIGWNRVIDEKETTFGVSGLLYNSNIIPYDRSTDSNWSQLLLKCVNGELSGENPENYTLIETTWKTWKNMYPSSRILSRKTGYSRSYGSYPYGSYRENESLIFTVSNTDSRLHAKERVLCIIENAAAKAYTFEILSENKNLITDTLQDKKVVVTGNSPDNLMVAFQTVTKDGTALEFQYLENKLPEILIDNEGTTWDIFGRAVSGPRKGEQLKTVTQMMGYWFSFAAFYPNIKIYPV